MNDYLVPQDDGFSLEEFGISLGNVATGFLDNVSGNFNANTVNNMAVANVNLAKAEAIKADAQNRKLITRNIFIILIVSVIMLAAVSIAKKFIK